MKCIRFRMSVPHLVNRSCVGSHFNEQLPGRWTVDHAAYSRAAIGHAHARYLSVSMRSWAGSITEPAVQVLQRLRGTVLALVRA